MSMAALRMSSAPKSLKILRFALAFQPVYLFLVWLAYFRLEMNTRENIHFNSIKVANCEGEKYAMWPYARTPAKSGYKEDANIWLFESHRSFMFDSGILFNMKRIGAWVNNLSVQREKMVILFYDARLNWVIMRIDNQGGRE